MRELKFRAWLENVERVRETDGKIVYNTESYYDYAPIINNNGLLDVEYGCDIVGNSDEKYIIEQYTGLKDKNGKEIYEGDIVSVRNKNRKNEYDIGVVEFGKAAFRCPFLLGKYHQGQVEVIGNVHENADLLEENNGKKD